MSKLDKLWDIEKHYTSLEKHNEELNLLREGKDVFRLEEKLRIEKLNLEDLKRINKESKGNLRKLEQRLQILNDKIKSLDNTIYNGSVKDIKQLEHLEKEKDYHIKEVSTLEDNMLDTMESIEKFDEDIAQISIEFKAIESELKKAKDSSEKQLSILNDTIIEEEKSLSSILGAIDQDILDIYHNIRSRKGSGIAKITNNACGGCHMLIPENLVEKAKLGVGTTTCENCGRILFIEEE